MTDDRHLLANICRSTNVGGEHVTRPTFVGGHLVSANKCRPSDRTTDICWPTKMADSAEEDAAAAMMALQCTVSRE